MAPLVRASCGEALDFEPSAARATQTRDNCPSTSGARARRVVLPLDSINSIELYSFITTYIRSIESDIYTVRVSTWIYGPVFTVWTVMDRIRADSSVTSLATQHHGRTPKLLGGRFRPLRNNGASGNYQTNATTNRNFSRIAQIDLLNTLVGGDETCSTLSLLTYM